MNLDATKTFETLECWKACRDLRSFLQQEVMAHFPKNEFYELRSQIIRAARSTTANIAEGYGRYHYLENRKFCLNARGSLFELLDHLIAAHDENYIDKSAYQTGRAKILSTIVLLNGYISWISAQHAKSA